LAARVSTIKELSVAHVLLDITLAPRIPWILYLGDCPLKFLDLSHYDVPRLRGQVGKAWISWMSNSGTVDVSHAMQVRKFDAYRGGMEGGIK
jgi:hypothetical protein